MREWGRRLGAVALVVALHVATRGAAQAQTDRGETTFKAACSACHTIGGGRLVGPDLQGLHERRSEPWIIGFVQHSQKVIASGDTTANALFKEYQVTMPDQALSADEVRGILAYIRRADAFGATPAAAAAEATEEQIQLGQELFEGRTRFVNAGPMCNSCHEVRSAAAIGGGTLAPELTTAFSRLGAAGLEGIIKAAPFPVMRQAYQDRPVTDEEVTALTGFLRRVDEQQALHHPRGFGLKLFAAGLGGAVLLLGLYSLAWSNRLKGSVNQGIYDRQIKST
jgi:cytochrome c2